MIKRVALVCLLLALAGASIVPLDAYLVLGTPRVGLVESRYVSDGLIRIVYDSNYGTFEAYAVNEQTLHILFPLVLLVDRVYYPLSSNSTEESKIVRTNALSASLAKDQTGRLFGIWMLLDRTTSSTALVTVSYYNELNVSSVATITFEKEKALRNFDNGTWQMQQTFQIANISPYLLHIGPIFLYHSTGQYEVRKNVTGGFADISYTDQGYWLYFNGDLEPRGRIAMTVTYNRPAGW
jgi:hypothetical protein